MKKLVFALALACSLQFAYAQKPDAAMQKDVDKALEASKDAKKATKAGTWTKLAEAYMKAYANPTANITPGIDKNTFGMMNKEKPVSQSNVEIGGQTYEKWELSHVNVYFNEAGVLSLVEVTKPSVEGDVLCEAAKAYAKAFELGAKEKDVAPKLKEIADAYYNDGFTAYQLGDMAKASDYFMGAFEVSSTQPVTEVNNDAAYNAAFTAMQVKNYDRANKYYTQCLTNGFYSDGNVYANLSECALAQADTTAAKNYLATGLTSYPDNAAILTNLINLGQILTGANSLVDASQSYTDQFAKDLISGSNNMINSGNVNGVISALKNLAGTDTSVLTKATSAAFAGNLVPVSATDKSVKANLAAIDGIMKAMKK
jgi:tetratricopeptide (TPR) repeat protein